jgi:DNA-binding NarL/FixJ family response regulator
MRWDRTTTPRYVVGSAEDARRLLRRISSAGWQVREGFEPADGHIPARPQVRYGVVADQSTAALVVRAAAEGAGVVAVVDAGAAWCQTLIDDLSRLGPVRRHYETLDGSGVLGQLQPEQRALLERLAAGQTIAAAAAGEFLSLRTANRRIAEVRALLNVSSTRDAVTTYVRLRGPA